MFKAPEPQIGATTMCFFGLTVEFATPDVSQLATLLGGEVERLCNVDPCLLLPADEAAAARLATGFRHAAVH